MAFKTTLYMKIHVSKKLCPLVHLSVYPSKNLFLTVLFVLIIVLLKNVMKNPERERERKFQVNSILRTINIFPKLEFKNGKC